MSLAKDTTTRLLTIALVGNPNTGKSTLFNALAGMRQRVGNYPGCTVEKKTAQIAIEGRRYQIVDLPGTYSLAPRSPDEMIAVDVLLGRRHDVPEPDVVLCIVDASNLERNLYLVSQVLELGRPTVVAMNMIDIARQKHIEVDHERLIKQLGVPVVPIQANWGKGLAELKFALSSAAAGAKPPAAESPFPDVFRDEVSRIQQLASGNGQAPTNGDRLPRYLAERLLLDTSGYLQSAALPGVDDEVLQEVRDARARLAKVGLPVPGVEAMSRYQWVAGVLDGVVTRPAVRPLTASDKLDHVLTHKIWGTAIFALMMLVMFQSVFTWAGPAMDLIDGGVGWFGQWVASKLPEGALQSLVVDGVIAGVGGVIIFLPQIVILFFFIAVLEDCGYMARAAYLMDKLMSQVGLSGKSFIPLLSSFACAIPGIMAARVIENSRDRLVTMLVAPLMSCSARLPVYILLTAAFIPALGWGVDVGPLWFGLTLHGITMFSMYLVGIIAAVVVALTLKRTVLKGPTPPFVMELPAYKWPSPWMVLHRMFDRGWAFVRRAGTLIVAVTVIVWAAGYYPHNTEAIEGPHQHRLTEIDTQLAALENTADTDNAAKAQLAALEDEKDRIEKQIASDHIRQSYLGRMGQWVEPVVRPLGWDWRIGCAAIASFPAREVVVGTLGTIYSLGSDEDAESVALRDKLKQAHWDDDPGRPVYNIPVALSIMVFFALCAQCASTLVIMRRETNSWRWPVFTFVYMTALAYVAALVTYQVGMWIAT